MMDPSAPTPRLWVSLAWILTTAGVIALGTPLARGSDGMIPPPDPLARADGTRVTTPEQWRAHRRALLATFADQMYGQSPTGDEGVTTQRLDDDPNALNGRATRRQLTITFPTRADSPRVQLLIYLPHRAKPGPLPVILGLNFQGNATVHDDPGIRLPTSWLDSKFKGVVDGRATDASRGTAAHQWDIPSILDRGYALATAYAGDIAPDHRDNSQEGVRGLYPELQGRPDNFVTVAAWAWGLSRILDALQTDPDIDAHRVAVFGHSRMGKAALWAGANDERFALVISNNSGAGGARLFHRDRGERIRNLNTAFPHWFCERFKTYNDQDANLPFDQNQILALIAPRPLYVASAQDDAWADPEGEFLSAKAADPVYRLLGTSGLPADTWPPVGQSVQGQIGYHVRPGKHDVTPFDWKQYLDFADKHLAPKP